MNHIPLFLFAQIDPLDNIQITKIKGCEILGDNIHFQIIGDDGKPTLKKVKKTQFVMNQIAQFQISIEANI